MSQIINSTFADTPPMRELTTSNHLLDDRTALDAAWERDGYWFFRDVINLNAIDRLRANYLKVLNGLGVVDPDRRDAAIHNGAPLEDYPIVMGGAPHDDPLLAEYPATEFIADPAIKAFFTELLGEEPFWVPNSEFHAVPPNTVRPGSRFNFVHQDGANNKGLPLRVCWIPLAPIDEATGGLALAEGLHRPRMGDFPRPPEGIKESEVPVASWRRALYRPGDLVVFSLETPHSGLGNHSERHFRLSMDIRCMPRSAGVPTVGKVVAVDHRAICVETEDGEQKLFRLDEQTFCRIWRESGSGQPLKLEEIPSGVTPGSDVYVASVRGTATFIRPCH